jgi:glycosyltransferase involved in cell wall biosynthesis
MKNNYPAGVSVIVCCFNSAGRIVKTLTALAQQKCEEKMLWEIIIVDNGCTDETQTVAVQTWETLNARADFRVVFEAEPGLANAREKGIAEAKFSVVVFCDDDNWLCENYVQGVFNILQSEPDVAACGGMGVPVFETEEPFWFYNYTEAFALGSQIINENGGKLLNLYGAGLAVKKNVFDELKDAGFKQILKGRTGKKLSSAEDTELTYAMVLIGYRLYCTDDLKFFHFLPKERLTIEYLKKLFIAFGTDGPVRNLYNACLGNRLIHKLIKSWSFHFTLGLFRFLKYFILPPKKYGRGIYFNWSVAYIKELWSIRRYYGKLRKQIESIKKNKSVTGLSRAGQKSSLYLEAN